jgi:hypothetical protein
MQDTSVTATAHVIQLSLSPIFLLLGIGTMLAVITNRLGRIVDRARKLQELSHTERATPHVQRESHYLMLQRRMISQATTLLTIAALLVTLVVAVLFTAAIFELDASSLVATLFVVTMGFIFSGLVMFLREVLLATSKLRLGLEPVMTPSPPEIAERSEHAGHAARDRAP